jgi:exodeoxyribonuclease V alpha subunit
MWTVTAILRDGSITAGKSGFVDLPAEYVRAHVDLAYAVTVMGAKGRTVDGAMLLLDRPTDVRGLYVAMSRGVHTNEAYIVTDGEETAVDVFERCLASDWIDQPAVVRRAELRAPADQRGEPMAEISTPRRQEPAVHFKAGPRAWRTVGGQATPR